MNIFFRFVITGMTLKVFIWVTFSRGGVSHLSCRRKADFQIRYSTYGTNKSGRLDKMMNHAAWKYKSKIATRNLSERKSGFPEYIFLRIWNVHLPNPDLIKSGLKSSFFNPCDRSFSNPCEIQFFKSLWNSEFFKSLWNPEYFKSLWNPDFSNPCEIQSFSNSCEIKIFQIIEKFGVFQILVNSDFLYPDLETKSGFEHPYVKRKVFSARSSNLIMIRL